MSKGEDSALRLMVALEAAAPAGRTMLELAKDIGLSAGSVSVLLSLLRRSGVVIEQRATARTGVGSYGRARPRRQELRFCILREPT